MRGSTRRTRARRAASCRAAGCRRPRRRSSSLVMSIAFVAAAGAAELAVLRAVAGRAGVVFWYSLAKRYTWAHAVLSRPGHGRGAGRRLAGGRRTRRVGAVAARPGDRVVGGRLRRPLRLPGPRRRSPAAPEVDSGALRRRARRLWISRAMHVGTIVCLALLGVRRPARADLPRRRGGCRGACSSTSSRS